MKPSRKLRHWIVFPIAVATLVVAIIQVADFSGELSPRRGIFVIVGIIITIAANAINLSLDRREKKDKDTG